MKIFSFGGGVQSTACLVLQAQGKLDYDYFVFANTGDDSENPATIKYMNKVTIPYARKHGIDMRIVAKTRRDGEQRTLYQHLQKSCRTIDIPVRMANGAPGNRNCTAEYKIKVVSKFAKSVADYVRVGIGISTDEWHRMKPSKIDFITNEYPLIDMKISRLQCHEIIEKAGLPTAPKSSCWFCPFKRLDEWQAMARDEPEQFQKVVELERTLNEKRKDIGKDEVYFSSRCVPLDKAIELNQLSLFEDDCTGYCWT